MRSDPKSLERQYSPPARGVLLFWVSCFLVLLGFYIDHPLGATLLLFIIPVFYGSHEALHDSLIPKGASSRGLHNELALRVHRRGSYIMNEP
jgi:hypothetical protein